MELILISGLSGSGKSIALNALEDAGFYCVDNLPASLLQELVNHLTQGGYKRVAVAVDMRAGASIAALPEQVKRLRENKLNIRSIFLEARDDTLIARFSETRRRHPLATTDSTLAEAIAREREALVDIAMMGHRMDTSDLPSNTLRSWIKDFLDLGADSRLTLLFESFGFKHGIPLDADLVFDVRCLPNPHYDPVLRPMSGKDAPIRRFLEQYEEVHKMAADVRSFISNWLPSYSHDSRSYLTVAIGCTGGQHRSVYLAERLATEFQGWGRVLLRHRNMKGQ